MSTAINVKVEYNGKATGMQFQFRVTRVPAQGEFVTISGKVFTVTAVETNLDTDSIFILVTL